jgi:IS4 transposase
MSGVRHTVVGARSALVEEMSGRTLGDQRLHERRDRLMAVLEQHPDTAFPDACANDAEVEALYRFLRNRRVSLGTLVEPHVVATHARCVAIGEVLVIHDTTDMVFAGEATRAGLAPLGKGRQGFWLHTALAVSADGLRAPLGLLSLRPFVRQMHARGTAKNDHVRFQDPEKESRCWGDGVAAVRTRFGDPRSTIHVMDRAGDSYELFAALLQHGDRFVVRLNHDRRVRSEDGSGHLHEMVPRTQVLGERQVQLSTRGVGDRSPKARQQHPPREGRVATLQFAARPLTLQRPHGRRYSHVPAALPVHVVYVWEVAPPPGEAPVEWRLLTTEPIQTLEQVLRIVDWYRARWLIEEFFKALKTGCAYEKRQLESLATLLVALALLAPIAWQLLLLRHVARAIPDGTATAVLSPRQLQVLQAAPAGARLGPTPTVGDALLAVARLGGHLRQNGDPGWLVLGRGMQKLLWMEAGWVAAQPVRPM